MAFQDDVGNLLVRAHLSEVPKPVVYGALLVFASALAFIVFHFAGVFGGSIDVIEADADAGMEMPDASVSDSMGSDDDDGGHGEGVRVEEPVVVVVHVAGAVVNPGVYPVPEGSRVKAVVDAAGGLGPQACSEAVNLARIVSDGEQVYIPTVEEVEAGKGAGPAGSFPENPSAGASSAPSKVNINTADAAGLDVLPGVGPATAQRIVADREANGPFASPEDIMRVPGIGEKKYEQMADMIAV